MQTQCLQSAPHTVVNVQADDDHRDAIERATGHTEARDDVV